MQLFVNHWIKGFKPQGHAHGGAPGGGLRADTRGVAGDRGGIPASSLQCWLRQHHQEQHEAPAKHASIIPQCCQLGIVHVWRRSGEVSAPQGQYLMAVMLMEMPPDSPT